MNLEERVLWNQVETQRTILESSLDWLIVRDLMGMTSPATEERLELVRFHYDEFLKSIGNLKDCCRQNKKPLLRVLQELDDLDRAIKDAFRSAQVGVDDQ